MLRTVSKHSVTVAAVSVCRTARLVFTAHATLYSRRPRPSPFITVLVMCSSLKGATPSGARRSPAGLTSRLDPVMVIFGSLGGRTITTALMSGMKRQESSPKHLVKEEEAEIKRREGTSLLGRRLSMKKENNRKEKQTGGGTMRPCEMQDLNCESMLVTAVF